MRNRTEGGTRGGPSSLHNTKAGTLQFDFEKGKLSDKQIKSNATFSFDARIVNNTQSPVKSPNWTVIGRD